MTPFIRSGVCAGLVLALVGCGKSSPGSAGSGTASAGSAAPAAPAGSGSAAPAGSAAAPAVDVPLRNFSALPEGQRVPLSMAVPADAAIAVQAEAEGEPVEAVITVGAIDYLVAHTAAPYARGDLARAIGETQGVSRKEEFADGFLFVTDRPDGVVVSTVQGRIACTASGPRDQLELLLRTCRSATAQPGEWPVGKNPPLSPEALDACARLYVMASACGYRYGGGDVEGFYKEKGVKPVAVAEASAECQAQKRSNGMSSFGVPPVPVLEPAVIATLEAARARGCAAFKQAYEATDNGLIEDKPFSP
ncbi:MAG: hypothetical protein K8W52_41450 [Deltaproteobacteria bacterium]|nr:hypothetical protein [Deltaproteobacteria bacterium]